MNIFKRKSDIELDKNQTYPKSFYLNIALLIVALVLILLVIFFIFIRMMFVQFYEEDYSDKTLDINEFIAAQVDGDKIEKYAKTLEKDDEYFKLTDTLYEMKSTFDVEYIYIMVDTGEKDKYTYIFDTVLNDESNIYDDSSFGKTAKKEDFPGSEEVLKTGIGFKKAKYSSNDEYGDLYYSYKPIFNSRGKVVAFLGTDIDASPMVNAVNKLQMNLIIFAVLTLIIVVAFVMFYGRRALGKPIKRMTNDIMRLSNGDIAVDFSEDLLKRKDELGEIYRAYFGVEKNISNLITSLSDMTVKVSAGEFASRIHIDEDKCKGNFKDLVNNVNDMLETIDSVLDKMPNSIVFYDKDFHELYHNDPPDIIFRIKTDSQYLDSKTGHYKNPNEIIGKNKDKIKEVYEAFISGKDVNYGEMLTFEDEEGTKVHYNAVFVKTGMDEDSGVCAVFTDVSEYVEISRQAQESSRAKSEFLSRMSHEIRTPMNAIIGMTEIATRNNEDKRIESNLHNIEMSARHLLSIINDILDLSKIEAGNMQLEYSPMNLKKLMEEIVQILSITASERNISLGLEFEGFSEDEYTIVNDDVRLRQVMINLITNAVKFSRPEDQVLIKITRYSIDKLGFCGMRFEVIDEGIGIEEEDIQRIFESFEQVSSSVTKVYGGTGLGLPISNKIVMMMGGTGIDVASTTGVGSTFSFELEVENAAPEMSGSEAGSDLVMDVETDSNSLAGKRILVVDDIDINREIVDSLLADANIIFDDADDGDTAIDKFSDSDVGYYDVILMDIQMKRMNGYEATKAIRNLNRPDAKIVRILGMSANAFKEDIEKGYEAGMNDYLTKPVDYNELTRKIIESLNQEK